MFPSCEFVRDEICGRFKMIFVWNSRSELISDQNGIYGKSRFSSFPLILPHAILVGLFAVPLFGKERKSTSGFVLRPPGGRSRWGVVQPVGHLTVNEDGEGSNPSAPANFSLSDAFLPGRFQPLVVGKPASFQPRQPPSMDSTFV